MPFFVLVMLNVKSFLRETIFVTDYLVFFMYMCNHMIFLVQFGINKHLIIFSKTTKCNFVSL